MKKKIASLSTRGGLLAMTAWLLAGSLLAGCTSAGVVHHRPKETAAGTTVPVSISPPLTAIPVGEKLEYQIFWWGVLVGTATLRTSIPTEKQERDLLLLSFEARSNWYLQAFYPVRVRLTSLFDPATLSPRRFESYLKRQWRVHESVITFNPERGIALHELPEGKTETVPLNPATQDGLSMLYYARTMPLQLGKTVLLEVAADGKNWALNGRVVQAGIVRIGNSGYWPALEGEVELAYPVPFFHGAKARVWFSADNDRIPLLAKMSSRIGPVTVVLIRRTLDFPSDS